MDTTNGIVDNAREQMMPTPITNVMPTTRDYNIYSQNNNASSNAPLVGRGLSIDRDSRVVNNKGYFVANYSAPDPTYYHSGPKRLGTQSMLWSGAATWNTALGLQLGAQDALSENERLHSSIRDYTNPIVQSTRLWLIPRYAPTPIPVKDYGTDPTQLMQGNVGHGQ